MTDVSFVAPVAILSTSSCIFSISFCFFVLDTVIPDNIHIFKNRTNKCRVYGLQGFPVQFVLYLTHDIYPECAKNHHLRGANLNVYDSQLLLSNNCSYKGVDVWVYLFYGIL